MVKEAMIAAKSGRQNMILNTGEKNEPTCFLYISYPDASR
jgi:hypothetical protein